MWVLWWAVLTGGPAKPLATSACSWAPAVRAHPPSLIGQGRPDGPVLICPWTHKILYWHVSNFSKPFEWSDFSNFEIFWCSNDISYSNLTQIKKSIVHTSPQWCLESNLPSYPLWNLSKHSNVMSVQNSKSSWDHIMPISWLSKIYKEFIFVIFVETLQQCILNPSWDHFLAPRIGV
jgi:hypothetical protein